MSTSQSARLDLPFLMPAQAQKHVTHNQALRRLDMLVQLSVLSVGTETPPAAPEDGDCYALGAAPGGAWAGQAGMIAGWVDGAWMFFDPAPGWHLVDRSQDRVLIRTEAGWEPPAGQTDDLDGVGIGTSHDATNKLAVEAPATLLTGGAGGHQLKINKAESDDTASMLFQSGWTGHAEIGLAGEDALSVKTSADGASWTTAMRFDAATGTASGAAVMADASDTTPDRLMPVGAFGLGEVSQVPFLPDMDSTTMPAGQYRVTSLTTNCPAGGPRGVVVIMRQNHDTFLQRLTYEEGVTFQRYCVGGTFGPWVRDMTSQTIVGTVSESGGIPTGAAMEYGSNEHGSFLRFADGTQICTNAGNAVTVEPAPFVGPIVKVGTNKLWIGRWF